MLFFKPNLFLLLMNTMLFLLVYPEVNAVVSYDAVLSKLLGLNFGYVFTLFFLSSLFFIIPIILITITLCFMKKYFNLQNQKCPTKSFETLTSILFCSYNIWFLIEMFLFFTKLGASDSYYYFIRLSSALDVFHSYYIMFDIIHGLLIHTVTFLILFSLLELSVTYKFVSIFSIYTPVDDPVNNTSPSNNSSLLNTSRLGRNTFYRFLIKCKKLLMVMSFIISFYILIILLGNCFITRIGADIEKLSGQLFSRLIHSFFINSFTLYIYFIFINEGVLAS